MIISDHTIIIPRETICMNNKFDEGEKSIIIFLVEFVVELTYPLGVT